MEFTNYILAELLVLIPVLYFIGHVLKRNNRVDDANIPLLLMGFGIGLAFLYLLSTTPLETTQQWGMMIFMAIVQGVLCAASAVGFNQVVKQGEKAAPSIPLMEIVEDIEFEEPEDPPVTGNSTEGPVNEEVKAIKL